MAINEFDKRIIFRELKLIREKSDLMIYAMQNDKDFPTHNDLEEVISIQHSAGNLKDKLKELTHKI